MNVMNALNTDKSQSPYLLISNSSSEHASVALQSTQVDVQVDGVIADVKVKQTYLNESNQTLEALYLFPGSTRAAVYGLDMRIGDREIQAQVKEHERARREYDRAKQQGKRAGLLEQHRPNVFQMNVANIRPGDSVEIVMHYTELLEHREGVYEFVYPGVVGPRYSTEGEAWVEQSIKQLSFPTIDFDIRVAINAGVPVQSVACTSHQIRTEHNDERHTVLTLANPLDKQSDRDFILQYGLRGSHVQTGMMCYEHSDGEHFFMLMAQPPRQTSIEQLLPREFIFIVDVSASMYGFPLEVSKTLLRKLLTSLRPIDRFNVMLFEFSRQMFSDQSLPATPENIEKALLLLDKQNARGGTNLYQALQSAFAFKTTPDYARSFLLVTDGYVTVESQAFQLVADQRNEANLFTLGIGSDVNRHLIEGLSYAGAGEAYVITNKTEAETVGSRLIHDITMPIWSHIEIDWGGFEVQDVVPISVPDLFAAKPVVIYGKYKGEANGEVVISGRTASRDYRQVIPVNQAERVGSEALRYLWARNRIKYLSDYASYFEDGISFIYQRETPKHQTEITALGLKYNLLTKYTSFLAVDEEMPEEEDYDLLEDVSLSCSRPVFQESSLFCLSDDLTEDSILNCSIPKRESKTKEHGKVDLSSLNQSIRPKKSSKKEKIKKTGGMIDRLKEKIQGLGKAKEEPDMKVCNYYVERGERKQLNGDYNGAIADFTKILELAPDFIYAYFSRARLLELVNKPEKARLDYEKIVSLSPTVNMENALTPFALFYLRRKQEAIDWQNKLLKQYPSVEAYYNAACLYAVMNETEQALHYLDLALKNGYDDFAHIQKDKKLDNLRHLPEFNDLIG